MKKFILLLILIPTFSSIFAAHLYLDGQVLDLNTREPLIGATVYTADYSVGTQTDILGKFSIKTDDAVETLLISYIGYVTKEISIENFENGVQIFLEPGALNLESIEISSNDKSLSTIANIDVSLRPIQSSQDVLRIVPGLFIGQHAGGGKAEQIFLRGFDIDHGTDISISVDGMPVNMVSHAHGQGYADLHFVIPELIQTVDFGKGPYYADQGNFNTAGYVDFQTKNGLDRSMVKMEAGQFNTLRTVALLDVLGKKSKTNGHSAYLAGEFSALNGPFDSPQNFKRFNFQGKYTYNMSADRFLSIQASSFTSSWDASGQIPVRAVESGLIDRFGAIDDTEGGETSRTNVTAKFVQTLPNDITLSNQLFYSKYEFNLFSNFTFFLENPIDGDQIEQFEDRNIYGYKVSAQKRQDYENFSLNSEVSAGFRYDDVNDNQLSQTKDRQLIINRLAFGDVDETNAYLAVDEKFEFGKLMVNAGVRLDYFQFEYRDKLKSPFERLSENKSLVSPKLNFLYNATRRTQVYLKTGIGFHSNDSRVVVAQGGTEILPKAYGADLGVNLKPAKNLFINAAIWTLFLEQEFVYVGDAAIVEPSGKTQREGIDLSARYQLTDWLFADLDFNYTRARSVDDPDGENRIPLAPVMTSIGGLTFQHKSGFNGSLRYRFIKDRPANEDNSVVAEGYTVLDANLNYTLPNMEFGIAIENLLNTEWREAQFDTESRLQNEAEPVSEIHFTPGTPFFLRGKISFFF